MIDVKKIQFVIVLYKENLNNSESFQTITKSLQKILNNGEKASMFVYDNSPTPQTIATYENWDIIYKNDPDNSGLSIAYNQGAEFARKTNKDWIFLLDQDTKFPEKTMEKYLNAIHENKDITMFVPILKIIGDKIMSPFINGYKWGKFAKSISPGIHELKITSPVNSGICMTLDSFFDVGGYNENVKVDGADFQFIERYKKKYLYYYVLDLEVFQNFSLFEPDINKVIARYKIFLADTKNFETHATTDRFFYHLLALKRTVRLFLDTKRIIFFSIYFRNYIFNKK